MNESIQTNIPEFIVRTAKKEDCGLILEFIKGLAEYEKMSEDVTATEEKLLDSLFTRKQAEVLIGELNNIPVAFALFFNNYSTFLGRENIYLEDLFVKEDYRNKGLGHEMFTCVAKIAYLRGCRRLDWSCLNWNRDAIAFYKKMGAKALDEWTVYRLEGEALTKYN